MVFSAVLQFLFVVLVLPLTTLFLWEMVATSTPVSAPTADEEKKPEKPEKPEKQKAAADASRAPRSKSAVKVSSSVGEDTPRGDEQTDETAEPARATVTTTDSQTAPSDISAVDDLFVEKKLLLAYASNSQSSLALAHKLFNHIQSQGAVLEEAANQARLRQQQKQQKKHDEQQPLTADSVADSEALSSDVAAARRHVRWKVKVLELRQEDARACTVETLIESQEYSVVVCLVSTFTDGTAPPRSQAFATVFRDAFEDHRVPRDVLAKTRFAVFGLGDIAYGPQHFNAFAKNLHEWCRALGAPKFVVPPVYATESKAQPLFQTFSTALLKWLAAVEVGADGQLLRLRKGLAGKGGRLTNGSLSSAENASGEGTRQFALDTDGEDDEEDDANEKGEASDEDLEDFAWDGQEDDGQAGEGTELPELLYPRLRANLTKQGYHLVGSHSGVKLCRWTKSMLRGRGGCYKHTFYNINSSQCMEMTPSLACANKCVFCWRHHTNPVSRTFRWKQDEPQFLIEKGMEGHYQMIKQMRGVPGVTPERLAVAMNIRHCALSLVGEPIMYPQINEFCDILHQKHISSFMVTNAQFPEQLRDLKPVVQLYLSIDAPTPEELKRVDRPLFEDYWERCVGCVRELRKKKQRTVFRLTLVNEYNVDNIAAYADLVQMGWPDFIEVKGVTYCGTSNNSTLTMKANVPRHDEVIGFCKALCEKMKERNPNYVAETMREAPATAEEAAARQAAEEEEGETTTTANAAVEETGDVLPIAVEERNQPYHIACEHEHSCCVLIALDKFYHHNRWHTWIDYEKFYGLVQSGQTEFTSLDYAAPTPAWATYNSAEKGFDPDQTRVLRKNARPVVVTSSC